MGFTKIKRCFEKNKHLERSQSLFYIVTRPAPGCSRAAAGNGNGNGTPPGLRI